MENQRGRVMVRMTGLLVLAAAVGASALVPAVKLGAQAAPPAAAPAAAPPANAPAKATALRDFTGYWVSEVTEEWRFRMVVPDKGDFVNVPLSAAGRNIANAWDPAKDQASGNACKGYGAAGIMYIPGRLHITWQDDNTLRIDTDSGTQTRLFHFAPAPEPKTADWQGFSTARWGDPEPITQRILGGGPLGQGGPEYEAEVGGGFGGGAAQVARAEAFRPPERNYLHVTTTHMRPGYLHKNGVPYGADATLDEYFTNYTFNGTEYLLLTSVVTDPQFLMEPYIFHTHYKKLPGNSGWDPTPCKADEPR